MKKIKLLLITVLFLALHSYSVKSTEYSDILNLTNPIVRVYETEFNNSEEIVWFNDTTTVYYVDIPKNSTVLNESYKINGFSFKKLFEYTAGHYIYGVAICNITSDEYYEVVFLEQYEGIYWLKWVFILTQL